MHTLQIPRAAHLESLQVDGIAQAAKSDDGRVRVALSPGSRQIDVRWQEDAGLKMIFRAPEVDAGAAGVNFRVVMELPAMRWLLLAGGPSQGPALLFWGYLVLILAAAWFLPRLPYAPLSFSQWLLLGLGLTQIDSALALLVVGWFFAVGSRSIWRGCSRLKHNLLQLVLLGYSCLFLGLLTYAVYEGLVSSPDMEVRGAGSYGSHLVWFSDRSGGKFASPWALSVSIWVWRICMLVWALWLSQALLSWVRWAYAELSVEHFWAPKPPSGADGGRTAPPSSDPITMPSAKDSAEHASGVDASRVTMPSAGADAANAAGVVAVGAVPADRDEEESARGEQAIDLAIPPSSDRSSDDQEPKNETDKTDEVESGNDEDSER